MQALLVYLGIKWRVLVMSKVLEVGEITDVVTEFGTELHAEIVRVFCPACSEEFIGTKRAAGGFVAGHAAFHDHENRMDVILSNMGGA